MIDDTHSPGRQSWVASANRHADFPIQNLPLGAFTPSDGVARGGIAIGDGIFDLAAAVDLRLLDGLARQAAQAASGAALNPFFALGGEARLALRRRVGEILDADGADRTRYEAMQARLIHRADACRLELPATVGDYTDFFAGIHHATNAGKLFRPDNPLLPNYKYVPIGYHGRASSIVVSGTDVKRPKGQNRSDQEKPPVFGPCKNLDYEMELGFFVGQGNEMGQPIPIGEAEDHIFGVCLVNDWSARDIQAWEYQPLGPFLAKNFATTVSPYVVTMEALAPFRTKAFERGADDPQPLEYLSNAGNNNFGGLDINLEVYIQSEKMRNQNIEPHLLSRSNTKELYWTIGQTLTHHASNGCNLQTGDLMGTGTVSGKEKNERGCLLELTWRGTEPLELPSGEQRRFLEDGDEVVMKGFCEREGFRRIRLGECRGRVIPAE